MPLLLLPAPHPAKAPLPMCSHTKELFPIFTQTEGAKS
jgi:hypothetical protein